jgi:predicted ATPase
LKLFTDGESFNTAVIEVLNAVGYLVLTRVIVSGGQGAGNSMLTTELSRVLGSVVYFPRGNTHDHTTRGCDVPCPAAQPVPQALPHLAASTTRAPRRRAERSPRAP